MACEVIDNFDNTYDVFCPNHKLLKSLDQKHLSQLSRHHHKDGDGDRDRDRVEEVDRFHQLAVHNPGSTPSKVNVSIWLDYEVCIYQ